MLYPAELRDRALLMARIAVALKVFSFAGAAWGAHPCVSRPPVAPEGRTIVAAGIVLDEPRGDVEGLLVSSVPKRPDRYDRWVGFLVRGAEDEPRQIEWLRDGLGYADPVGLKAPCRDALLAAEAEARRARRGVWRRGGLQRAADPTLAERTGRFAVVEGAVVSVGDRARTIYLNFGTFWRQDFTVRVEKRDLKRHPELLARLGRAEGRTIRVRGTLELRDGPFMRVRDAGQIEFPTATPPAR